MYTLQFEHTQTHFKKFLWSHFWRRQSFIVLAGVFLMPLFMFFMKEEGDPFGLMVGIAIVLYALVIMGFFALTIQRQSAKLYKNRSIDIKFSFDDQLFKITNLYNGQPIDQTAPYSIYKKMIETQDLILLYLNYNMATIIPKTSIDSTQLDSFIEFLKKRIPH